MSSQAPKIDVAEQAQDPQSFSDQFLELLRGSEQTDATYDESKGLFYMAQKLARDMITPMEKDVGEIENDVLRRKIGAQFNHMKSILKLGMDATGTDAKSAETLRNEYHKNTPDRVKVSSTPASADAGVAENNTSAPTPPESQRFQVAESNTSPRRWPETQVGQVDADAEGATVLKQETALMVKHHKASSSAAANTEHGRSAIVKVKEAPVAGPAAGSARSIKAGKSAVKHASADPGLKHTENKTSHKSAASKRTPQHTANIDRPSTVEKKEAVSHKYELSRPSDARTRRTDKTQIPTGEPRAARTAKSSNVAEEPRQTGRVALNKSTIKEKEVAPTSGARNPAPTRNRPAATGSRTMRRDAPARNAAVNSLPKQEEATKKPTAKATTRVGAEACYNPNPTIKIKKRPVHPTTATSRPSLIQKLQSKQEPEPMFDSDPDEFEDEIVPIRRSNARTAGQPGVAVPGKKKAGGDAEATRRQTENRAKDPPQAGGASQYGEALFKPQCHCTAEELGLISKSGVTVTTKSGYIIQTVKNPEGMILFKTFPAPPVADEVSKESAVKGNKGSQYSPPGSKAQGHNSKTTPNGDHSKATGGGSAPRDHTRKPESKATHKRKRGRDDDSPPFKRHTGETRTFARPKIRQQVPPASADAMFADGTPHSPAVILQPAHEPASGRPDLTTWSIFLDIDEL